MTGACHLWGDQRHWGCRTPFDAGDVARDSMHLLRGLESKRIKQGIGVEAAESALSLNTPSS